MPSAFVLNDFQWRTVQYCQTVFAVTVREYPDAAVDVKITVVVLFVLSAFVGEEFLSAVAKLHQDHKDAPKIGTTGKTRSKHEGSSA